MTQINLPTNASITFDLDGTLVDTAPDLVRVLNLVIQEDIPTPVPLAIARDYIGHGSAALIHKAYTGAGLPLPDDKAVQLRQNFLQTYENSISQLSKPYDGVIEVLTAFKRLGIDLSVCTNKPGYLARPLLADLGLDGFFSRVIGSDDTSAHKPNARHIFDSLGHRATRPSFMIGDGGPDFYAARAAKIPVILMSYGYSPVNIHTFGADAVLRSFRELPSAIAQIHAQKPS